jgi:Sulfotransferase domain
VFTSLRAQRGSSAGQSKRLPSFFILGPPRTGTTWLHEVLRANTLLPFPTKETRFFDQHFRRGLDWYLAHFPASSDRRTMGEVAPTYFASAHARERIAKLIPDAKVVCVFRNPVDRVLSLYRLKRAYGMFPWTFEQAILEDPELLESGRYATHLKAWFKAMGKDQVLVTVYEDLKRNPQAYLDTITDFLGIDRISLTGPQLRSINVSEGLTHPRSYFLTRAATGIADWFKAMRLDRLLATARRQYCLKFFLRSGSRFEALSTDRVTSLYEVFRPEIEELEAILKRDFPTWKSASAKSSALRIAA